MDTLLFKALSDGTRLRMIELLSRRSYCVRALSMMLGLSESAVSQHMKILRDAGLAEGVKYGYYTHYRLCREPFEALGQSLLALAGQPHSKPECDAAELVGCQAAKQS
ncbi:MAG: winged helix-turn-helix transcriptional regulator [Clostridia bacterium]|nr:winged helix-turn-helix transcriptional regulator [Clostridia bacterium]